MRYPAAKQYSWLEFFPLCSLGNPVFLQFACGIGLLNGGYRREYSLAVYLSCSVVALAVWAVLAGLLGNVLECFVAFRRCFLLLRTFMYKPDWISLSITTCSVLSSPPSSANILLYISLYPIIFPIQKLSWHGIPCQTGYMTDNKTKL